MKKQHLAIGFCVLAILVASISVMRSCGSDSAVVTKADWACRDCGHVYVFTEADVEAHYRDHYGEPLSCPECNSTEVYAASHCPSCDEAYGTPAAGNTCPHCGQPLPAP